MLPALVKAQAVVLAAAVMFFGNTLNIIKPANEPEIKEEIMMNEIKVVFSKRDILEFVEKNGIEVDYITNLGHFNFSSDKTQWISKDEDYTLIWIQEDAPDPEIDDPDFVWHYSKGFLELQPRYRGVVTDQLTGDKKQTKWYDTYKEAHGAAEKLSKRTFGARGTLDVITN